MADFTALKKLALLGAIREQIQISSSDFAQHILYSPQTASRRLQALEKEGLIFRVIVPEGQQILITQSGKDVLRGEYYEYQKIFEPTDNEIELHGKVVTGLGEGQYYMSLEGYKTQFESKLGFTPYPGTLNLVLTDHSTVLRKRLEESDGILINGFTSENGVTGGSGSSNDPYTIDNWKISCASQHGIIIKDTEVFFEIKDCYVYEGGASYNGIIFYTIGQKKGIGAHGIRKV